MSDFPSLSDLMKKSGASGSDKKQSKKPEPKPKKGPPKKTTGEIFAKKMQQIASKEKEVETMRYAASVGFPHIDLDRFPVSQKALRLISKEQAEKYQAVCFYFEKEEFRIGAIDPKKEGLKEFIEELKAKTQSNGSLYVVSKKSFQKVVELYKTLPTVKPITKDISISPEALEKVGQNVTDFKSLQELLNKGSTTDVVIYVMGAAFKLNASDVHVEAEEKRIAVRFRLDGILQEAAELPKESFKQLVNRLKLVAGLKLNITDKPQDGRFTIKLKEGDVDIRVSTMPTVYGESVVMRLLKQSRKGLTLDQLGLIGGSYEKLKAEIERPNGMVITTGPTGSGKTTTLYAVMQMLNKPGVKIITLEDPVEYRLEGLNQSQVDSTKGYTFAKGLKSILRQDPDICMVGEIRDLETAEIAIQAALTGHLMLSTIHTNSAAGTIPRFLSMGVKPFLLAPALNAVIGQRLVRKLKPENRVEDKVPAERMKQVEELIASMPETVRAEISKKPMKFFTSPDGDNGYTGRLGIYEIMTMSPELEQMVLSGKVSEFEIQKLAISQGMTTMAQDGIIKALNGETSLDEVFRVIE